MKSKFFYLTLFLLLVMSSFAQQPLRVAVNVTGGSTEAVNEILSSFIVNQFATSGKYIAIERPAVLGEELSYAQSGMVDDKYSKIGEMPGAQIMCAVVISDDGFGGNLILARMMDIETAQIISLAQWHGKLDNAEQLRLAAAELYEDLTKTEEK